MNSTRITVEKENGQKVYLVFSDDWNLHLTEYEWFDQQKLAHLIAHKYSSMGKSDYFIIVDNLHFKQDAIVFDFCSFGHVGLESPRLGCSSIQALLRVTDEECGRQRTKHFQAETSVQMQAACSDIPHVKKYDYGFHSYLAANR